MSRWQPKTREERAADLEAANQALGAQWAAAAVAIVQTATLMRIEEILEVGAGEPKNQDALLEECESVIEELLTIFVYKESLRQQFGPREERGLRLLEKLRRR